MSRAEEFLSRFITKNKHKIISYELIIELMESYNQAEMKRKIERINNITQSSFSEILNELKQ